jgi:2'-5' RNA ligase
MAEETVYSLWIRPHGNLAHTLQDRINEFSEAYNGPLFTPHLTLLGGLKSNRSELISITDLLAHSLSTFPIKLTDVDTGSDYFHCIFIKAKKSKELIHAHETAAKMFEVESNAKSYEPHVSLLYGNLSVNEKERIVNKMGRAFDAEFTARHLLLVRTSGAPEQWEKIYSVDLSA